MNRTNDIVEVFKELSALIDSPSAMKESPAIKIHLELARLLSNALNLDNHQTAQLAFAVPIKMPMIEFSDDQIHDMAKSIATLITTFVMLLEVELFVDYMNPVGYETILNFVKSFNFELS